MSAHTPGPWKVEDDGREVVVYAVEGSCRVASIELDNLDDRSHALRDARLIAAAPELLAALKWALPFAERFENTYSGGPRQRLMESKISEVRTAIAKAEGRS